jgi:phosphatidate cytidylyltransferase
MKRIVSSVIAIPLVIYVIQGAPLAVTVAVIFAAMLLALHEYFALTEVAIAFRCGGFLLAAAALFLPLRPELSLYLPAGVMLLLTIALFAKLELADGFRFAVLAFFGAFYVGGLMSFLIGVRMSADGPDLLMMLFVVIWAGDSFAYFAGKSIGKHKLAPVVSPMKTWEGAVAGFLFSILAAIACKFTFIPQLSLHHAAALGALIGIVSQIGDLCESIIKPK